MKSSFTSTAAESKAARQLPTSPYRTTPSSNLFPPEIHSRHRHRSSRHGNGSHIPHTKPPCPTRRFGKDSRGLSQCPVSCVAAPPANRSMRSAVWPCSRTTLLPRAPAPGVEETRKDFHKMEVQIALLNMPFLGALGHITGHTQTFIDMSDTPPPKSSLDLLLNQADRPLWSPA